MPVSKFDSPIKFVGGKRKFSAEIIKLMRPNFGTYTEPFVGGGSVFLKLVELGAFSDDAHEKYENRCRGTTQLCDADEDLIKFWCAVQDDPKGLHEEANAILKVTPDHEQRYYNLRTAWNTGTRTPAMNLVLRYSAFNGIFRVNKSGQMNSPWNHAAPRIPSLERLYDVSQAIEDVSFSCRDFRQTMQMPILSDGDSNETKIWYQEFYGDAIYYVDSPYLGGWVDYTANGWTKADAIDLLTACQRLTMVGAQVIVSHSDTEEFRHLMYEHWPSCGVIHTIGAARSINSKGSGRGKVREIVAVGNPI